MEERQDVCFNRWPSGGNIRFVIPEAKAGYKARITRLKDAFQLKKMPDRIPIFQVFTFTPVALFDATPGEVMYDGGKLVSIWKRFLVDMNPSFT